MSCLKGFGLVGLYVCVGLQWHPGVLCTRFSDCLQLQQQHQGVAQRLCSAAASV
jgi:hypothetical protein